ncbi:MAG: deoxyribodipyrimidine photo-lyase, partial [Spirochaetes bacterium]|nr:deoxyribodipyrimidine photo-lyase [Spirochaetota bacterium]
MKLLRKSIPVSSQIEIQNGRKASKGQYVLLWIKQTARFEYNLALNYAIHEGNLRKLPIFSVFCVDDCYPVSLRHLSFQLKGILELIKNLSSVGIPLIITRDHSRFLGLLSKAEVLIADKTYFSNNFEKSNEFASVIENKPFITVETETICPVKLVSPKEEYSAATFRPKINRLIDEYLFKIETITPKIRIDCSEYEEISDSDIDNILINADCSVPESSFFLPGESEAVKRLNYFLDNNLKKYPELRSDPSVDCQSNLSPYLHF